MVIRFEVVLFPGIGLTCFQGFCWLFQDWIKIGDLKDWESCFSPDLDFRFFLGVARFSVDMDCYGCFSRFLFFSGFGYCHRH